MSRKSYGTLTAKPVDIDNNEREATRRELAALQGRNRYVPDAYFWNRSIREARRLDELRTVAGLLVNEVQRLQQEIMLLGYIPPKFRWAPGEREARDGATHLEWANDNSLLLSVRVPEPA